MTILDHVVNLSLAVVLIVGTYQFYFWCQRKTRTRARSFSSRWDDAIRLRPNWVWIYSGLYYPVILVVVTSVKDVRQFNHMAFSYLVLLVLQMSLFLAWPVEVPGHWRDDAPHHQSLSRRFLNFVQAFDAKSNCFPSMHASVATLTALHIARNTSCGPALPASFVVLISASCILTKQHYMVDVPAGVLLGWFSFKLFMYIQ